MQIRQLEMFLLCICICIFYDFLKVGTILCNKVPQMNASYFYLRPKGIWTALHSERTTKQQLYFRLSIIVLSYS